MTDVNTCPKCNEVYHNEPAISRSSGEPICSECGTKEALNGYLKSMERGVG